MTTYIALLRGINVGGKNIIRMDELKRVFNSIGLMEVQTYIQSGNVLFKSDEEEEALRNKIESEIKAAFGLELSVVLRTDEELKGIIRSCPFTEKEIREAEASSDSESLYVAMLTHNPLDQSIERLDKFKNDTEAYRIIGRDIYLLFHDSIRNSKLANNLSKLDVPATVRNWKTINKLAELAKDM